MKIGEALVKNGLITHQELELILKEQENTKERIGDIAVKKRFTSTKEMAPFLAKYFQIPFIQLRDIYKDIRSDVIGCIPQELARRFTVIPISLEDKILTIAMHDPLDVIAIDTIKLNTGLRINRVVASEEEILEAVEYCYHQMPQMKEHIKDFVRLEVQQEKVEDFEKLRIEAVDPPIIKYVNSLMIQGVNSRASDIHIRPKQDSVELGFRIDGVLYNIDHPPKSMLSAITTRIKILANLDIAERRLPQDGRFKVVLGMREIDVRTSCFPTIYGESIVMRLLDTSSPLLDLERIGFSKEDLAKYRNLIRHSYGLVLVTGPTGSGKTTTLYASMNEIKSSEKNMLTLEDPVEYRLHFAQQSQVNPGIGFDFARGLRSILRQDPDIIMVGEIRDKETAEIAIHAALTGHLVFATLHTNDSAGAAVRLINMGVEPFLISSSLLGVLAQRLIRTICDDCKGKACRKCMNSGYRGRTGIFELLIVNETMRKLIMSCESSEVIRRKAQEDGMKTLRESGKEKLASGITTPQEVLRVTQEVAEL